MAYPHRIRLRGPWECEPLVRSDYKGYDWFEPPLPAKCRMLLPCRWASGGLGDFGGRVRFRRRFGYPGRIDAFERVWLTFAGLTGTAEVWLNGHFLAEHEGTLGPFELEVTNLLAARNELVVEVLAEDGNGGLWGEVAMEVRCTAFLRALSVKTTFTGELANLHVAGEVVGTCERPLELYVLLDNATVAYGTSEAAPAGQPFQLVAERLSVDQSQPHLIRVDLVNGASIWYTFESALDCRSV